MCTGLLVLSGCSPDGKRERDQPPTTPAQQRMQAQIDSMEVIIKKHNGKDADGETTQVLEALRMYQNYATDYPADTTTASYLIKMGQIYYNYLKDYENAEEYLTLLTDSFPASRHRPMGLYFLANTYHETGDTAKAQAALTELRREYAGTEFATMAAELSTYIRRTFDNKESEQAEMPAEAAGGGK